MIEVCEGQDQIADDMLMLIVQQMKRRVDIMEQVTQPGRGMDTNIRNVDDSSNHYEHTAPCFACFETCCDVAGRVTIMVEVYVSATCI